MYMLILQWIRGKKAVPIRVKLLVKTTSVSALMGMRT